jgi:flagellar motor protein MotB
MNDGNTDENVGWPSYVDFLSTFIFLLILFIGCLVFQVSGVIEQHKKKKTLDDISKDIGGAGIPNYVRQNKIIIPLAEQVNFAPGKSFLDAIAQDHLTRVGHQIALACADPRIHCKRVMVEGHADNVPVKRDPQFGNLRLSADRALEVLRFFYVCGTCGYGPEIRSRLILSGEGDIAAQNLVGGSQQDRRVDVILDFGSEHDH